MLALVKDATGRIVERMSNDYPLEGPLDRLPALKRGNIVFKRQLWLAPGRYTLSSVARDQASDRASVQRVALDVPAEREGVRVSSVSVIRRVDQASEQADAVEDPFRSGPMRIVPSLDTPISKGANAPDLGLRRHLSRRETERQAGADLRVRPGWQGLRPLGRRAAGAGRTGPHQLCRDVPVERRSRPARTSCARIARQGTSTDASSVTFTVVP